MTNSTDSTCGSYSGCTSCVEKSDCWWCPSDKSCFHTSQDTSICSKTAEYDEGDCGEDWTAITLYAGIGVLSVLIILCCCVHWRHHRRRQKKAIERSNKDVTYLEQFNSDRYDPHNVPAHYQPRDGRSQGKHSHSSANFSSYTAPTGLPPNAANSAHTSQTSYATHGAHAGTQGTIITNHTQNYVINAATGTGGGANVNVSVSNTFVAPRPAPTYVAPHVQHQQQRQLQQVPMQQMAPQQAQMHGMGMGGNAGHVGRIGQAGHVGPMGQAGHVGPAGHVGQVRQIDPTPQGMYGMPNRPIVKPLTEQNVGMLNSKNNGGTAGMEYGGFVAPRQSKFGEKSVALLSNDENLCDVAPNAPVLSPR